MAAIKNNIPVRNYLFEVGKITISKTVLQDCFADFEQVFAGWNDKPNRNRGSKKFLRFLEDSEHVKGIFRVFKGYLC